MFTFEKIKRSARIFLNRKKGGREPKNNRLGDHYKAEKARAKKRAEAFAEVAANEDAGLCIIFQPCYCMAEILPCYC